MLRCVRPFLAHSCRTRRHLSRQLLGVKRTPRISTIASASDPNVWSGRALQENFVELTVSGLASMYPASDWSVEAPGHHGYQRACDLISV
jgi:hypothetical protein